MPYSPKTWNLSDPITDTDLNRIEVGIDEVTDDFETHIADDTGWLTTGITAASNWTLGLVAYRKLRGVVFFRVQVTRAGSTFTPDANGNITDQTVFTLPSGYRPAVAWGAHTGNATRMATFSVATTGVVQMVALANATQVQIGDTFYVIGSFPV